MLGTTFQLDTKGTCLLCLSPCSPPSFSVDTCGGEIRSGTTLDTTTLSTFRVLLRYLNVEIMKLSHFSSSFNRFSTGGGGGSTEVSLSTTLCNHCLLPITHFSQLFQEFEHIRLQLDACVAKLYGFMEEGVTKVKERGFHYRNQLKCGGHPGELIHASIAEELRGEILQKCSLKLRSVPRIALNKCDTREDFRSNSNETQLQVLKPDSIPFSETQTILPASSIRPSSSVSKKRKKKEDSEYTEPINSDTWLLKFATFEKCEGSSSSDELVGLWKCRLCGNGYTRQSSLKDHLMASHPTKYFSNRIPPSISERGLLKTIAFLVNKAKTLVTKKDGRRRRKCCFCKKVLTSEWLLKMHMLRHHFDEIIEEVGSPCVDNFRFIAPTPTPTHASIYRIKNKSEKWRRLFRNQRTTPETVDGKFEIVGDKWKCLECGKLLSSNLWNFKQHYYTLHSEQSRSQPRKCFQCECGNVFTNSRSLDTHRLYCHMMDYFSEVIPPSVSEHHLELTLANFTEKAKESRWTSEEEDKDLAKCSLCGKNLQHDDTNLRIHFLRLHWAEVVEQSEREAKAEAISTLGGVKEQSNANCKSTSTHRVVGYAQRRLYQLHKRATGSPVTNKCEHCARTFGQYNFLRNHIMTVHPFKFFAHRVPESVSRADFEQAMATMSRRPIEPRQGHVLECSVCKKGFGVGRQVRLHLLGLHFQKVMEKAVRLHLHSSSPSGCDKPVAAVESESSPVVDFVVEYNGGCKPEPELNPNPCITQVESLTASEKVKAEKMDLDNYNNPVDVARVQEITIEEAFLVKTDMHKVEEVEMESGATEEARRVNKLPAKYLMGRGKEQCRCPICGKILYDSKVRSAHLRDVHHLRQMKNPRTGHAVPAPRKCDYCDNVTSSVANMLLHALIVHPIELLSDQLPSGVTKSQINASVESILAEMRYVPNVKDQSKLLFGCPMCKRQEVERCRLRAHILDKHFENVVEKVNTTSARHDPKLSHSKKCSHCDKSFVLGKSLKKHMMALHATILFKDRLPPGTSEGDFLKAVESVTAKIKVLPRERHEPRRFAECTICSKRVRSVSNELKIHVLRTHFDEVFGNVEKIHEGLSVSPECILPDDVEAVEGGRVDDEVQLEAVGVNMTEESDPLSI